MLGRRNILKQIENLPSEILSVPPPKKFSSPIPSKNFFESPNKSFDKENHFEMFSCKSIAFDSLNYEPNNNLNRRNEYDLKKQSSILEKEISEGKFKVLLEQSKRLIEIVNETIEEKEFWKYKYGILEELMQEKSENKEFQLQENLLLEKPKKNELIELQENLKKMKVYFIQKLDDVIRENDNYKLQNKNCVKRNNELEKELEAKRDIFEKFEEELLKTKIIIKDLHNNFTCTKSRKRSNSLNGIKVTDFKLLEFEMKELIKSNRELNSEVEKLSHFNQEKNKKTLENKDSQLILEKLYQKSEKYSKCKKIYQEDIHNLKTKLFETQKENSHLKNKYQILFKESNERIQTISLHYEESQKTLEKEIEKNYEEEKEKLMTCLMEERKENHIIIEKLNEKIKFSENEMNELKENISVELEDLGGKYNQQQEKYKEKEDRLINEVMRQNVNIFMINMKYIIP